MVVLVQTAPGVHQPEAPQPRACLMKGQELRSVGARQCLESRQVTVAACSFHPRRALWLPAPFAIASEASLT